MLSNNANLNITSRIPLCVLTVIALLITACNSPVALGSKLNLTPPTVTMERPAFMENVGQTLVVSGTAADAEEVAFLTITVEYAGTDVAWKQEWRGERGVWRNRASTIADKIWTAQHEPGTVRWSVALPLEDDAPSGEYLVSVGVENNVKKTGIVQQRRVIRDIKPPIVTIINPIMQPAVNEQEQTYDTVFDTYTLREPSILNRLHNQQITLQYEIDENVALDSLYFQLTDAAGTVYYNQEEQPVEPLSRNGTITIPAKEIVDAEGNPITDKTYVQLLSTVTDKAGNSKTYPHGWLVWWPASDKPWVSGIGHEEDPQQFSVYPGATLQGQAYDDDGVSAVAYTVYREGSETPVIPETSVENPTQSTYFNWNIPAAPAIRANYRIEITCWDSNNPAEESTVIRHLYVNDSNAPNLTITAPSADATLFGDTDGNVTLSGTAGDGTAPEKLHVVWFNPLLPIDQQIPWQSSEYAGWNSGTPSAGIKLFAIDLDTPIIDPATGRALADFNHTINLFTDFPLMSGESTINLSGQLFIFRIQGASGRSITVRHAVRGDIQAPTVNITTITADETDYTGTLMPPPVDGTVITASGTWADDSFTAWNKPEHLDVSVTWNGAEFSTVTLHANGTWTATMNYESALHAGKEIGAAAIEARLTDRGSNTGIATMRVKIDTTHPRLLYASSENADGAYKAGDVINIYIEFNKPVDAPADAVLKLNNGQTVNHSGGNGTSRHEFTYTVNSTDMNTATLTEKKLNVTSIEPSTGWQSAEPDSDAAAIVTIPDDNNLAHTKSIIIDTVAPAIAQVSSRSGDDHAYKADAQLYLMVTFTEPVLFTPGSGAAVLSLQDCGTVSANVAVSGQDTIPFDYKVDDGHNTLALSAASLSLSANATVTDMAGNALTDFTIPSGNNINDSKTIVIDTTPPVPPEIHPPARGWTTYDGPQTFTITGEAGASLEFSLNGDDNWLPCPPAGHTLSVTGTYAIKAQQIDRAGNKSLEAGPHPITIQAGKPFFNSIGLVPGTYITDDIITITLKFNEDVTVEDGSPQLLFNNGKQADYTGGSGTNTLTFKYTVADGDDIALLEMEEMLLNGAVLSSSGMNRNNNLPSNENWNLSSYGAITIDTLPPEFVSASLDPDTLLLTITFSKPVYTNGDSGIHLVQQNFLAPPVIMADPMDPGFERAVLKTLYTRVTNDYDANGESVFSEKWVLNYDKNTSDSDVVSMFEGLTGIFYVRLETAVITNNTLTLDLSDNGGAWEGISMFPSLLPAKGVSYALQYYADIVRDEQNRPVAEKQDTDTLITFPGVEKPVIRVKKANSTMVAGPVSRPKIVQESSADTGKLNYLIYSAQGYTIIQTTSDPSFSFKNGTNTQFPELKDYRDFDVLSWADCHGQPGTWIIEEMEEYQTILAQQPLNAEFKIDCQTPGAVITYAIELKPTSSFPDFTAPPYAQQSPPAVQMPVSAGISYDGNAVPLLSLAEEKSMNGYRIGIKAVATKNGAQQTAYAVADRSVVRFTTPPLFLKSENIQTVGLHQLILRGGDSKGGYNQTLDFPLSWWPYSGGSGNPIYGTQLMSYRESDHTWYWVSWGVNRTAYIHFEMGYTDLNPTSEQITAVETSGIARFSTASGGWATLHDMYPLHPGGSLIFTRRSSRIPGEELSTAQNGKFLFHFVEDIFELEITE